MKRMDTKPDLGFLRSLAKEPLRSLRLMVHLPLVIQALGADAMFIAAEGAAALLRKIPLGNDDDDNDKGLLALACGVAPGQWFEYLLHNAVEAFLRPNRKDAEGAADDLRRVGAEICDAYAQQRLRQLQEDQFKVLEQKEMMVVRAKLLEALARIRSVVALVSLLTRGMP